MGMRFSFSNKTLDYFETVPCHGEFYRYVQWHNNAYIVAQNMQVPVHVVHYRDFYDDYDKALDGILSFLKLEKVAETKSNMQLMKKFYYSKNEEGRIKEFVQKLADPEIWPNLERYFQE